MKIFSSSRHFPRLVLAICLLLLIAVDTSAFILPGSMDFATLQQTTLKAIDASVGRLNSAEQSIQADTALDSATKTSSLDSLNSIESQLNTYRAQVAQATTLDQLKAINQQAVQYVKANKDAIRTTIRTVIAATGGQAAATAQQFFTEANQVLQVLLVTCPSQKSAITATQQQLAELEKDITSLQSAVTSKNSLAIKSTMQAMNTLLQSLAKNLSTIDAACTIPTP